MITVLASIVLAVTTPDPRSVAATLQARVDAAVAEGDAPALSAAVVLPDGEIVCAVAGNAGDDNPTTLGCDTRFLSGSVGKTVTALVTANLVADRGLDLDAPISTWLSDRPWWSRLRNRDDITLRMLLNGKGNCLLRLGDAVNVEGSYGIRRRASVLYLSVDELPAFSESLSRACAEQA